MKDVKRREVDILVFTSALSLLHLTILKLEYLVNLCIFRRKYLNTSTHRVKGHIYRCKKYIELYLKRYRWPQSLLKKNELKEKFFPPLHRPFKQFNFALKRFLAQS